MAHLLPSGTSRRSGIPFANSSRYDVRMSDARSRLSPHLRPILDLELARGNAIDAVEEGLWSACPLAVRMREPLHFEEIRETPPVEMWENWDAHYSIEKGV